MAFDGLGPIRITIVAMAAAILAACGPGVVVVPTSKPLPSISSQPQNVTVDDAQSASFKVTATGLAPLAYQWQRNGQNITGATSATYILSRATIDDNGAAFSVVVADSNGSVRSNVAVLYVNPVAPSIMTQPAAQAVNAGATAGFAVSAQGTAPLQFQWLKNGVAISGATNSTYYYLGAQVADDGARFSVRITNIVGNVTSNAALLTVRSVAPTIVTQPQAQTAQAGASATFSVVANGTAPLGFQWRRNGVNIAGATSASYVTPATVLADSGASFDVVVTNSRGSTTSAAAVLTVNPGAPTAPSITTQPQDASAAPGDSVTFTVVADGTQPLSYQWSRNGSAIAGATNSSYILSPVSVQNNRDAYSVVITNAGGAITSRAAVLTVTAPPSGIDLLAGRLGGAGNIDGVGAGARFNGPSGVAVDAAGNIFIADFFGCTIRKVSPNGTVTHIAGGQPGFADGVGGNAQFNYPSGLAVDAADNLYVADTTNFVIRKITAAGVVSTIAGTVGVAGAANGTGMSASFSYPRAVTIDAAGNLYVADPGNYLIRKITPGGVVSTLAGTAGVPGAADGAGTAARFAGPFGIAVDGSGNVFVADTYNNTIRKITSGGVVTTIAGNPLMQGATDGTGSGALFNRPQGLVIDSTGNLLVSDTGNNIIRRVTPGGVVTTVAGSVLPGSIDATGSAARFFIPWGIGADAGNNLYVADFNNQTIRKITTAAAVTTLAGSAPAPDSIDGVGANARLNAPEGTAVDAAGNAYVADTANSTIRKVTSAGAATTLAGTPFVPGSADGAALSAQFNAPEGVAVDGSGTIYVADSGNSTIRRITAAGTVSTFAGKPGITGSSNGSGSAALFKNPAGIAVDKTGNVYVADTGNSTIRMITPAGVVTTLAGTAGVTGGADGVGGAAQFNQPQGLIVDALGRIYVADTNNFTVRMITLPGVVTTVAGTAGIAGHADGTGSTARLDLPSGIAVDSNGNVYVTGRYFAVLRKITPAGVVSTVAGYPGAHGVVLGPLPGSFNEPVGLALVPGPAVRLIMTDRAENSVLLITLP